MNKHCPLCYADDSQELFFLHCKYNKAEERRGQMKRDLLALYKDLRSQYADQPDLSDLAVELCADMRSTLDNRHRYLVLLGHWMEQLQATLMEKLWAERSPRQWRHPSKYGMVKQLIVGIGEIGTKAIHDIWLMRCQA